MQKWSSGQSVRTEYIVRLDDACPTMDAPRWSEVESLLVRHDVKPIVAVVPANAGPGLGAWTWQWAVLGAGASLGCRGLDDRHARLFAHAEAFRIGHYTRESHE